MQTKTLENNVNSLFWIHIIRKKLWKHMHLTKKVKSKRKYINKVILNSCSIQWKKSTKPEKIMVNTLPIYFN